jgi:hypothetical protein
MFSAALGMFVQNGAERVRKTLRVQQKKGEKAVREQRKKSQSVL